MADDKQQTSLEDKVTTSKSGGSKSKASTKDKGKEPAAASSAPKESSVSSVPEAQVKNFEVLETCEIPRGASTFRLNKGKIVSRGNYDIRHLKAVGAKLKPRPDLG